MYALNLKPSPEKFPWWFADPLPIGAGEIEYFSNDMSTPSLPGSQTVSSMRLRFVINQACHKLLGSPEYGLSTTKKKAKWFCDIARRDGLAVSPGNAGGAKSFWHLFISVPINSRTHSYGGNTIPTQRGMKS